MASAFVNEKTCKKIKGAVRLSPSSAYRALLQTEYINLFTK
jgi:hypothetical protein